MGSGVDLYFASNTLQGCVIDIYRPQKRFLQVVVPKRGSGGNQVIASITALTYHFAHRAPRSPETLLTTGNIAHFINWLSNPGPGNLLTSSQSDASHY